ncbi:MAG TPA: hypothetical protein VFR27_02165 [Mycobacterium sp.]|nr:hypothetical protein [Mycobacterium sp.]
MGGAEPIIVVLGPRCGGTSAVAGVLHHLDVFMGSHFSWAIRELGEIWEDVFLAQICERAFIGGQNDRLQIEPAFFRARLRSWAEEHRRAARSAGRRAGVKHPILCTAVDSVRDACGPIVPVVVDRPVEQVVASLMRLGWFPDEQEAAASTKRLIAARDHALADTATIRIDFDELRASPDVVIRRLAGELELKVTDAQIQVAVQSLVQSADVSGTDRYGTNWLVAKLERNPDDARSMFLLAETLYQMGDFARACKVFYKRTEMGGWDQEIYFAMFRVAELMAKLGEPWPAVENAYLRAWELHPASGEPLCSIGYQYYQDSRFRLGHLFAKLAAEMPLPERGLTALGRDYTIAAIDLQAMCEFGVGKHIEAFRLWRRLLTRPDLPDPIRQVITTKRNLAVPAMLGAASSFPAAVVEGLAAGPPDTEITVSLVAGPDRGSTEATLNSFLNCCTDICRVGRFLIVDAGLAAEDRTLLAERYGFVEFADAGPAAGPGVLLARIRVRIGGRFWLHLGGDWRFFALGSFITRLTAVLEAEPQVFQVGINLADAVELTDAYVAGYAVRRAPDTDRYTLADRVATGPAMFDTTRLDRIGGIDDTDTDPIAGLQRRSATAGLRTASLDEVLCVATTP